jgi:universal stress protein A
MEDVDPDDYLTQPARELLADFARRMEISHCPQHVFYGGGTTHEIIQFAQAMSADLIIVGSHGQHGISHLLGSTAGSLLHHADCDVLVVRAREQ